MNSRPFEKYDRQGAYHWDECDERSRAFNPPLVARYRTLAHEVRAAKRIVDIGSGDGYLTALLCTEGAYATGVEVEPTAVRLASSKLDASGHASVIQGSCYQLPIASESCDAAVMADVIEHLEQPGLAIREAARVLTSTGVFALTTPKWRPDRMWDLRHVQEFKPAELRNCLERNFRRVDLTYFWPLRWSNFYSSRLGWRALKLYARVFPNPFMQAGDDERRFGQMLAVCTMPVRQDAA